MAIMEAAESLFVQKGYNHVSIKEIATAAGINGAQVFYYFVTKEKLLEQMLEWRIGQLMAGVQPVVSDESVSTREKLSLLINKYIEQGLANPLVLAQLFYENAIDKDTASRALIEDFKDQSIVMITEVIRSGQQQGVVKKSVDATLVTGLIMGTITYMVINKDDYHELTLQHQAGEEAGKKEVRFTLNNYLSGILQSIMIYE